MPFLAHTLFEQVGHHYNHGDQSITEYHQTGTITMENFLTLLDKAVIKQKMEEKQLAI